MKNKKQILKYSVLLIAFAALMLGVFTLAKYAGREEKTIDSLISEFEAEAEVLLEQPDGSVKNAKFDANHENFFRLSLYQPDEENYIGNLRIKINYKGQTPFYIRVRAKVFIVDEINSEYHEVTLEKMKLERYDTSRSGTDQPRWFDNYSNDSCFYYAAPVSTAEGNSASIENFINGVYSDFDPEEHRGRILYMNFDVETVQINRFPQFWNHTELPWRSTS